MNYPLRQVCLAVAVFYTVLLAFDARGIYNWTNKLSLSPTHRQLRSLAEQHWRDTAKLGLEEPKFSLETMFLDFQDAHPLVYPKKYPDFVERRRARAEKQEQALVDRSVRDFATALLSARRAFRVKERAKKSVGMTSDRCPNILLIGDSIMAGIGPVIKNATSQRLDGSVSVRARVATGLARPDIFDWQRELEGLLAEESYDTLVLMIGTNDSQDLVEDGEVLVYGTTEWVKAYNQRIAQMMETSCQAVQRVLWIGLPPMRNPAFNRKITRINSWAKRQTKYHPCVEYVALDYVIGDENGKFVSYLKIKDDLEKVRMVDGIHITTRGGILISDHLLPILARQPDISTISH